MTTKPPDLVRTSDPHRERALRDLGVDAEVEWGADQRAVVTLDLVQLDDLLAIQGSGVADEAYANGMARGERGRSADRRRMAVVLTELEEFIQAELDRDPRPIEDYLNDRDAAAFVMELLGRIDDDLDDETGVPA